MTELLRSRAAAAYRAWERWWFTPQPTSTLAVIRIVFGVLAFLWTLSHASTLFTFLTSGGIVDKAPDYSELPGGWGTWSLLTWFPGKGPVVVLFVLMLLASICLIIGFRPRIAALIFFIGVLSFERRNPYVYNSGDVLIRLMALYLALSPCGEALSLDRWRRARDRFWEFPSKTQWALRLMQLQVSFVYLSSVWAKVRGTQWNDGTAVSYALRIGDLHRWPVPSFLPSSEVIANFMTFGALATEFAVGTLVWNRKARPYVLLAGVSLHLGIDWALTVGFFSYGIILFYLSFVDPNAMSRFILRLRDRLARRPAEHAAVRSATA
jgi:hypothetical protein